MIQRFDLIGCEKVSHRGPVGEAEDYGGEAFGTCKDRCTGL